MFISVPLFYIFRNRCFKLNISFCCRNRVNLIRSFDVYNNHSLSSLLFSFRLMFVRLLSVTCLFALLSVQILFIVYSYRFDFYFVFHLFFISVHVLVFFAFGCS